MKKHLAIISALCLSISASAQDIHFSQFYENAILRNPALTGIFSGDYKAGINYRTQWSNISVPFQTVLASAESRVSVNSLVGDYLSFGLTTTYDHAGTINFNSLQVYPAINYNKSLEDDHNSYLSVGFAGGYMQRSADLSKATYSTQYNGSSYDPLISSGENFNNSVIRSYDLSAGVSFNGAMGANNDANYYIGAAAYHLNKPRQAFNSNEAFLRLQTKWVGNLGFKYNISEVCAVTAHFNYNRQGQYQEIMGGGLISWRGLYQPDGHFPGETPGSLTLYLGAFVRYQDAIIPTFKIDYHTYSLTCSYDINTSPLKAGTNNAGGFEMSLFVRGQYKKSLTGEQLRCPHFEQMLPMF